MINRKFIIQIAGTITGLLLFMLGLMTPLSTIAFCGIGVGLIVFNTMVSSFVNITYSNINFILPLVLMTTGITIIFMGLLSPLSIMVSGGVGMVLILVSVNRMIKTNHVR